MVKAAKVADILALKYNAVNVLHQYFITRVRAFVHTFVFVISKGKKNPGIKSLPTSLI